ncbi:hypothetical protein [Longimicrobium sp.]|uniref:hypothetical protein n=1 Tax=Longimicrobium sp. TaxID=2029185 RepID=UPI003B3B0585
MAQRRGGVRCTAVALLWAWVAMVFGSSALLVLAGVAGGGPGEARGLQGVLAATWRVADEVGPAAKILLIAAFAALVLAAEGPMERRAAGWRYAVNIGLGAAAMLLALALIPAGLSRGFGIGLTGARLDLSTLPFYLAGGVLGAVVFTASAARCRGRVLRASGV